MDHHLPTFRAANPTLEEGRTFALFLDQAAEGFFRLMLGRRSAEIIARAFTQPEHDLSYQYVTFASHGSDVVGMVSGYTADAHRRASEKPLMQAAGVGALRMMVVSRLFAPMLRAIDTMADGDFYLQAMAVDPAVRGLGVGSALLDTVEARARAAGSKRLVLDVSAKNLTARRLYAGRGMVVESRWPRRWAIMGLRILRMAKSVDA